MPFSVQSEARWAQSIDSFQMEGGSATLVKSAPSGAKALGQSDLGRRIAMPRSRCWRRQRPRCSARRKAAARVPE
eukprot:4750103-Alexandrium_andersonii.AAC.1